MVYLAHGITHGLAPIMIFLNSYSADDPEEEQYWR
jgi:hypothetical protein